MKTPALRSGVAAGIVAIMIFGVTILPSFGHHSFAMYDQTVDKVLTGRLVRFIIGANHSQFIFELVDEGGNVLMENGEPVQWGAETGPAVTIGRQGITPDTFKIGTIFTITVNPLRDGRNFGAQQGNLIMCGMAMPAGGCSAETGQEFGRGGF